MSLRASRSAPASPRMRTSSNCYLKRKNSIFSATFLARARANGDGGGGGGGAGGLAADSPPLFGHSAADRHNGIAGRSSVVVRTPPITLPLEKLCDCYRCWLGDMDVMSNCSFWFFNLALNDILAMEIRGVKGLYWNKYDAKIVSFSFWNKYNRLKIGIVESVSVSGQVLFQINSSHLKIFSKIRALLT